MSSEHYYTGYLDTPIGILQLGFTEEKKLCFAHFNEDDVFTEVANSMQVEEIQTAIAQLKEYFEGTRKTFSIPLAPKGTYFQKKVWEKLEKIPFGKTASYQEMANQLGDPKVIRAAASANGKNPIAVIIPCHRVIGSDGSLTGYAGGLHRKKWLLEHESPVKQQSLF
ncbi:methylated-DNA--[protein]-cysteine S-methyltransferase [Patiriisocius hiemis]|uniref:Methylated-DNA--protein-cysteine methyltransferase n=1 Tax=Patiriisocius hiemis TaxID=3075604 RepID=A0ABU2YBE4_9FLAO|nr:methylated-DNA--[protein]-cysteine S-methyltransferase [Constantimarinum sp. W242]MDT0555511.1 methylated-DNA--[protein]-cysteine S-methyltransferase [Constantimarinum sp. W242]